MEVEKNYNTNNYINIYSTIINNYINIYSTIINNNIYSTIINNNIYSTIINNYIYILCLIIIFIQIRTVHKVLQTALYSFS